MTEAALRRSTFAEYLALEHVSNVKHEYIDGLILAMAGGTPEHAALAASVIGILFGKLRGGRCRVYDADLRVRVLATGRATYPDVTIVCGSLEHDPEDHDTIVNPTVLVEVLSKSTEEYDRGDKLDHYKRIESLREVVFVAWDKRRIDVWRRDQSGWVSHSAESGQQARLEALGCALDVDEVYESAVEPNRE